MESFDIGLNEPHAMLKPEEADRLGFIRKVYSILSMQLLLTTTIVGIVMTSQDLQEALLDNVWLIGLALLGSVISMLALICSPSLAHKVPTNYWLLGVFTVCEAILVAVTCVQYDPVSVFVAALMTLSVTLALTAYAYTTKTDFSMAIGFMLVVIIAGLFFAIFMPIFIDSRPAEVLICSAFALIYGVYIIIDTQLIAGGGRYKLSTDDYILGSMYLYVDIIGLFLEILRLIGDKRK
jgi:FtsH-binding integral membrane protein